MHNMYNPCPVTSVPVSNYNTERGANQKCFLDPLKIMAIPGELARLPDRSARLREYVERGRDHWRAD